MIARRITLSVATRDMAHTLAGAIQNLIDPPPEALTLFDVPETGGWRIDAYYDDPPTPQILRENLSILLGIAPSEAGEITLEDVPELNWVALSQAALPPVIAGRFTIHGSHDTNRVPQGPGSILIDAGEAFGTAHHATTYGCLLAIDQLTRSRTFHNVLDLGCGSGVLAIAVHRALPRARITATDLDAPSIGVARENARLNGCGRAIAFHVAGGLNHPALRGQRYDLLIANILADPLIHLARDIAGSVAPGGNLILSGLLVSQAPSVIAAYRASGFHLTQHARIHEWATLVLRRQSLRTQPSA